MDTPITDRKAAMRKRAEFVMTMHSEGMTVREIAKLINRAPSVTFDIIERERKRREKE